MKDLGFNRISFAIQDFNPQVQEYYLTAGAVFFVADDRDLRPDRSYSKPMSAGTTVGVKIVENAKPP
ncbi:MAG: hypothetical protein C4322_23895, partial [Mastigocladus sp. ERB_26_1]